MLVLLNRYLPTPSLFSSLKGESMDSWGQVVNNKDVGQQDGVFPVKLEGARHAAALGGQTQEEATDEAAGQDNILFDEVCGLHRRIDEKIKAAHCLWE